MISAVNKCSCSLICFKNRVNAVGALYGYLIKCGAYSPAYIDKCYVFGNEKLNCWFTGFFPADEPQYAVTVMIEEGISGNITCGPVFKEIADSVRMRRYGNN